MRIMMQLAIVFALCLLGEAIASVLPFPFPASVISMILVFLVLLQGQLKVYHIRKQTDFLLDNMAFFFIPAAVSIMDNLSYMQGKLVQIILICFISTVTTFFITAWSVQLTIKLQNKWKGRRTNHDWSRLFPLFWRDPEHLCL